MLFLKNIPNLSEEERKIKFTISIIFSLLSSFVVGIVFLFIDSFFLKDSVADDVFFLLPPLTCLVVFSSYLRAREEYFYSSLTDKGTAFLGAAIIFPLLIEVGISVNLISVLSFIVWALFFMFMLYFIKKKELCYFDFSIFDVIKIGSGGGSFTLLAVLSYLTVWFPAFLIENYSVQDFIDYNLALRFVAPFTFLITTVDLFASTKVTKLVHTSKHHAAKELYLKFVKMFIAIGLFYFTVTVFLAFFAADSGFFSQQFLFYYITLVGAYVLSSSIGPSGVFLNMYGRVKIVNKITLLIGFLGLVASLVLLQLDMVDMIVFVVSSMLILKSSLQCVSFVKLLNDKVEKFDC